MGKFLEYIYIYIYTRSLIVCCWFATATNYLWCAKISPTYKPWDQTNNVPSINCSVKFHLSTISLAFQIVLYHHETLPELGTVFLFAILSQPQVIDPNGNLQPSPKHPKFPDPAMATCLLQEDSFDGSLASRYELRKACFEWSLDGKNTFFAVRVVAKVRRNKSSACFVRLCFLKKTPTNHRWCYDRIFL